MTTSYPELQNWAGGTLKLIRLIGINSRFALIDKKAPIGLVANKYTKLGKPSGNLILSHGLSYIKIPMFYGSTGCGVFKGGIQN